LATLFLLPAALVTLFSGQFDALASKEWLCLCWLANPVLWVGLRLLARGRPRGAAAAGAVALPLALAFLLTEPSDLRAGYYAWAGSMALLLLAGLAGARAGPVRRLPDAGPMFAARRTAPGEGVQLPTDSLRPPPCVPPRHLRSVKEGRRLPGVFRWASGWS
jgi:hypothetical protein